MKITPPTFIDPHTSFAAEVQVSSVVEQSLLAVASPASGCAFHCSSENLETAQAPIFRACWLGRLPAKASGACQNIPGELARKTETAIVSAACAMLFRRNWRARRASVASPSNANSCPPNGRSFCQYTSARTALDTWRRLVGTRSRITAPFPPTDSSKRTFSIATGAGPGTAKIFLDFPSCCPQTTTEIPAAAAITKQHDLEKLMPAVYPPLHDLSIRMRLSSHKARNSGDFMVKVMFNLYPNK